MTFPLPSAGKGRAVAALAVCLTLAAPALWAQSFDAVRIFRGAANQDGGSVALAVIAAPEYAGSDKLRTQVLPGFDYQWANGWFVGLTNGLGYDFSKRPDMQYGLRLTFNRGRDQDLSSALRGMGDVDFKPEVGAFYNYFASPQVFLTSSLRYGAGNGGRGLVLDLGAGWSTQLAAQWRMVLGGAVTAVNADYMQSFFGVTPKQSAASGYTVYTPSAGVRDLRANFSLNYFINREMTLTGALSVSALQGDAKSSPLTRQATSTSGVLALSYSF